MTTRSIIILILLIACTALVLYALYKSPPMPPLETRNSDGSDPFFPVVMFDKPWQYLRDLFFTAVHLGGSVCLGVLLLLALVMATGFHRFIF